MKKTMSVSVALVLVVCSFFGCSLFGGEQAGPLDSVAIHRAVVVETDAGRSGRVMTLNPPTTKFVPEIIIRGSEVVYRIDVKMNHVDFIANLKGELTQIAAWLDDFRVFDWSASDDGDNVQVADRFFERGHDKSRLLVPLTKWQKYFREKVALPPIQVITDRTEATEIGSITRSPLGTIAYERVGTAQSGETGFHDLIVLKSAYGEVTLVREGEFLFPPPEKGQFRLARKMGKLVALVQVEGQWMAPASDYIQPDPKAAVTMIQKVVVTPNYIPPWKR